MESLRIAKDGTHYALHWVRGGQSFEKLIARADYEFYRKGDRADAEGVVGDYERENVRKSLELAFEILNLDPSVQLRGERPFAKIARSEAMRFVLHLGVACALAVVDAGMLPFVAILLLGFLLEYVPRVGRLLTGLIVIAFPFAGFPACGVVAGLMYSGAQFLDSNPIWRRVRISVPLISMVAGIVMFDWIDIERANVLVALIALIVVFPCTALRWAHGSHFRAFDLVAPFLAVALAFDAGPVQSFIVVIYAIALLGFVSFVWRFFPHPPAATYQGVYRHSDSTADSRSS